MTALDLATAPDTTSPPAPPPAATMLGMITGAVWVTKAIYVAASLEIADRLSDGPKSVLQLAKEADVHQRSLYRVLRALASIGVFIEDGAGRFALTPLGETLRKDVPGSLHAIAVLWGEPRHWQAWGSLLDGVKTGKVSWELATGQGLFEYFAAHADMARMFDAAMISFSEQEAVPVAAAYDTGNARVLVDIGGGQGYLLSTFLGMHPTLRGILYELPHVVDGAREKVRRAGLGDRIEVVAGDFFQSVPSGGDLYLLKNILHDFDDDAASAILTNIRRAVGPHGKVLIVQEAIAPGNGPSVGKLLDMQMLLIGGKERTEEEYRALLSRAGFRLARVIPTACPLHIIEGEPI